MKRFLSIACIAMMMPLLAMARPVSYAGGTTLMQMNDADRSTFHFHYSPSINYSLGYKGEYWRDEQWQFHGAQLNNLIKRWNKPASQANLYLKSAVGLVISESGDRSAGAFTGVSADWENRRFFTLYENRFYEAGDVDRFFMQKARVGVAPYIGDYGDVHTWLMVQVDHKPEQDDTIVITPLIRVFKNEYLAELGISDNGDVLINWVMRF